MIVLPKNEQPIVTRGVLGMMMYPMTDPYVCNINGLPFTINIPQLC